MAIKNTILDAEAASYFPQFTDLGIANGASESAEFDLNGAQLVGIQMPAAWTAANLTFEAATASGGTFQKVMDDAGTEYTVTAAASEYLSIPTTSPLFGLRFIKVRSGTSGVPVNQGAARTLTLVTRVL